MNQQQKSAQTQQLILDTAFQLFYKNGFKATSVGRVMKATQLTKGAFYHHFKNKQELGVAVITQRLQQRVYNSMIAPLYTEEGDTVEMLQTIFTQRIQSFSTEEKQAGCPANNFINEIGDTEIAYPRALRRIIEEWKVALMAVLERGKNRQQINLEINSEAVAVYLISAFEGVRGIRKLYHDDLILENYLEAVNRYIQQLR